MTKSVLVIEDDFDISANMKTFLEYEGFSVHIANHGAVALEYLSQVKSKPDVIVLDLMMPIMDGWEFRRRQLEDKTLSSIPVIVATASGMDLSDLRVRVTIKKPIDLNLFLQAIEQTFQSI